MLYVLRYMQAIVVLIEVVWYDDLLLRRLLFLFGVCFFGVQSLDEHVERLPGLDVARHSTLNTLHPSSDPTRKAVALQYL